MRQYQKIVYVGPLGVSENLILEKVENIPATIKIHIILLKYHLTLAYRDAKYLFPIFEIDTGVARPMVKSYCCIYC